MGTRPVPYITWYLACPLHHLIATFQPLMGFPGRHYRNVGCIGRSQFRNSLHRGLLEYSGREMEMTATLPDGEKVTLIKIDDWDLDWQDRYQLAKPLSLPAGTKLYAEIIYDNSAENPYSPPQRIQWGRESNDEMGAVTVQVIAKDETDRPELQRAVSKSLTDSARSFFQKRILDAAGVKRDDVIDADELQPARQQLQGRRR